MMVYVDTSDSLYDLYIGDGVSRGYLWRSLRDALEEFLDDGLEKDLEIRESHYQAVIPLTFIKGNTDD